MKALQTIKPTREQAEKIYGLLNDLDPDYPDGAGDQFMRTGQACFDGVGRLMGRAKQGEVFIRGGQIGEDFIFSECFLVPLEDEPIFVRIDFDNRDEECVEAEIFVHAIEDFESVRQFVVEALAAAHMGKISALLQAHFTPDRTIEALRRVIETSSIGEAFKSDESARRIHDSLSGDAGESSRSMIRRPGL